MQLRVDEIEKWEDVVSSVDKENIPIDCVKKVVFKLRGNRQKTINLETLRRNGLDIEEIESVVSRTMNELGRSIVNIDFVIDVRSVAQHVQPITDHFLNKLKG
jgi:hypothetical protein